MPPPFFKLIHLNTADLIDPLLDPSRHSNFYLLFAYRPQPFPSDAAGYLVLLKIAAYMLYDGYKSRRDTTTHAFDRGDPVPEPGI